MRAGKGNMEEDVYEEDEFGSSKKHGPSSPKGILLVGHCNLFSNRLYNFTGKGDQDPSLDFTYAAFLKTKCQSLSDTTTTVEMDPSNSIKFNSHYYPNLLQKKGLFSSDAALLTQKQSADIAKELVDENKFLVEFSQSMKRLGAIGVLTGSAGEIRNKCSVVNS